MTMLAQWAEQLGAWLWFALALLLFVMETIVPGVHFLWFGVAAAIAGVVALALPISVTWQIVVFALVSFATMFFVRRASTSEAAQTDRPVLNIRGAQYIGRKVIVDEPIVNGRGKVRVDDTVWSAQGEDAARGTQVEVTGVNGTVLVVARVDGEWAD